MQNPLTSFRVCRINDQARDPAINMKAMMSELSDHRVDDGELMSKFAAYMATREERFLVLHDGKTPAWFTVKRLPTSWVLRNLDAGHAGYRVRDERAFRAGCHEIIRPDGSRLEPETAPAGKPPQADDAWTDAVGAEFGGETVIEIGRVAHDFSTLPVGQHGPFSFPLG